MSTTEIRETLDRLTEEERFFAAAYLHHLSRQSDPGWQREMQSVQTAMDAGGKFSLDQVRAAHESLTAQGL